ncbi:MAG: DinB family protein [Saprospiraceae bacterium]
MIDEFKKQILFYLEENEGKIKLVWQDLSEDDIWRRPNSETLAPANQLVHLTGNIRQWVLTSLGRQPEVRERDAEFALKGGKKKGDILDAFLGVLASAKTQLASADDLLRPITVQGHQTSAMGVWIHMAEHLSYHTGQLIFFAKQLHPKQYDFYGDWDLG